MTHRTKDSELGQAAFRSAVSGLALAGTVSLESVAKHLGTSPRTLQRRLSQRGLCFWTLVEQSRFEISGALLRNTDRQINEIAATLGYSTPGGFSRAFTRWAGCPPRAFRAACRASRHGKQIGAKWAESKHLTK
jgi:AraC-like DNA-binding protein